jgi:hypothetical protein
MTVEINGTRYFAVKSYAYATKRSQQNVRFLMSYGNKFRKLRVVYIAGKPMIPYSELTEYPFTVPGRNSKEVYHYDEDGVPVFDSQEGQDEVAARTGS